MVGRSEAAPIAETLLGIELVALVNTARPRALVSMTLAE
jgi:hypothetical protein